MGINIKGILKGTIFSVLITLMIILILAALAYFTKIGENAVTIGVYASVIIGVLMGALLVSKAAENKKFIHAMLLTVIYLIILAAVSFLINGTINFNAHFFTISGGILGAGFLGLVLGK